MSHLRTGFISSPRGSLHLSVFLPSGAVYRSAWVLHIPAFAEEMNKSRAMVARQSRALASEGFVVVVPDLFGTGDSSGMLREATWDGWVEDALYLVDWIREQGCKHLSLWGNRLGCLLVLEIDQKLGQPADQLFFWQPVHSGRQHVAQLFRLRVASGLSTGTRETVASLRAELEAASVLEIAGYSLSVGLIRAIESKASREMLPIRSPIARICEVSVSENLSLLPLTETFVQDLLETGADCSANSVLGEPFWMTQELGDAPELIQETVAMLSDTVASWRGFNDSSTLEAQFCEVKLDRIDDKAVDGRLTKVFSCEGDDLVGVVHTTEGESKLGVIIVVGGPQYRIGSHRQFNELARCFSSAGIPTLCFDYRGMGDSSGDLRGFLHIGKDISVAIDMLQHELPSLEAVCLWGLCDAATASVFYAPTDSRVKGLVLANPWVYSEVGSARTYLRSYYASRVMQLDFWLKVLRGEFRFGKSIRSAFEFIAKSVGVKDNLQVLRKKAGELELAQTESTKNESSRSGNESLIEHFARSLTRYDGQVALLLSGNDLTAKEFVSAANGQKRLREFFRSKSVRVSQFAKADHTFSRSEWGEELSLVSLDQILRISEN